MVSTSCRKRGQFAIEFLILYMVMFVIFLAVLAVATNKILGAKEQERKEIAQDIALLAKSELDLAQSVSNGYHRVFSLPPSIHGIPYDITIIDNRELVVHYVDQEYVIFLPNNVLGNISIGVNEIAKENGIITLNGPSSIIECKDLLDNDGDSQTDLGDAGCASANDNDETNCGDNVCESYESCLACSADCGICSSDSFLFLQGIDNVLVFEDGGNAILGGTLTETDVATLTASDEFVWTDPVGNPVAVLNLVSGDLVLEGSLFDEQASLSASGGDDWIIQGSSGTLAYFDEVGNFYLKGTLMENGSP